MKWLRSLFTSASYDPIMSSLITLTLLAIIAALAFGAMVYGVISALGLS